MEQLGVARRLWRANALFWSFHAGKTLHAKLDTRHCHFLFLELVFPVWGHTYRCGWRGVALVVGSLPKGKRLDQLPKAHAAPSVNRDAATPAEL